MKYEYKQEDDGVVALTVSGLIVELQRYLELHGDVKVAYTWEGIYRPCTNETIRPMGSEPYLLLDADYRFEDF